MQNHQQPTTLTRHIRDGLLEEQHFGFITRVGRGGVLETFGDTKDEPFYLRSCAKPLQASVIVDYDLPLTEKEIALACGSNAGEKCHYETAHGFAEKFGIKAEDLRCGIHKPLSKTSQAEIKEAEVFHNNCIGKHLTMLALCKKLGFSTENYDALEHPVQQLIIKKVNELCEVTNAYPITKDGCGVPILSMPLENMVRGFLNLFCDERYEKLTQAILNHPYIFGGEDRTDTKIVQESSTPPPACHTHVCQPVAALSNTPLERLAHFPCHESFSGKESGLICKVGAGGLCIVVNREKEEGFVVKVSDCDMKARELVVIDYINRLGWGKIAADRSIKTLHGEIIGEIQTIV